MLELFEQWTLSKQFTIICEFLMVHTYMLLGI